MAILFARSKNLEKSWPFVPEALLERLNDIDEVKFSYIYGSYFLFVYFQLILASVNPSRYHFQKVCGSLLKQNILDLSLNN